MDKKEKNMLLLRMAQIRVKLPTYAMQLYWEKFPSDINIKSKVTDVYNGRQIDEKIIDKFESLV